MLRRRRGLCRVRGEVKSGEHRVAEATLLLQLTDVPAPEVDPTARVAAGAVLGTGVRVGPYCVVGPLVRIGARTVLESHVVIDGDTTIGADNHLYPFCSVGLEPQDLKFRGEATRLLIGDRNTIREFVTIHRGTAGGGGVTRIGSDNLFMACAHIAHDCVVGNGTIFGNGADARRPRPGDGLRERRRVLRHPPVLPGGPVRLHRRLHGRHQGRAAVLQDGRQPRARLRRQQLGLARRGFPPETIAAVKRAFRVLLSRGSPPPRRSSSWRRRSRSRRCAS